MISGFIVVLVLANFLCGNCCTTFAVGRKTTIDGSVMATHSNDGGGTTDPRLVKVPAKDYAAGDVRPIYGSPEHYPRYVGSSRGIDAYSVANCQGGAVVCKDFQPFGFIPQVNHTLAYFEATYGVINEKQVSIAESTCSGVFVSSSLADGGKALLSVDQLSQIAMERAHTAKQAVELMGALAEQYGFYGESTSFEGGSESLFVIDPTEAWVFHILADPTGASALWGAARVPDDSVAVVANMFSIRVMDMADTANFLGSKDLWTIAAQQGLYREGDPKDFTKTFSDGEYSHKYYSGRRMWGVFRLLAPSANLPAEYDNLRDDAPYPFAVKVDKALAASDVMAVMRDWYEGTEYSTSVGLAGGAFNTPDRYSGGVNEAEIGGSWERTIGIYRSSDSFVVQARPNLPDAIGGIVWFGSGAAHSTVFVPILTGMLASPDCLLYGWQGVYNLTTSYWAHRSVLNLAQTKFSYMIGDIRTSQHELETKSQLLVDAVSAKYAANGVIDATALQQITEVFVRNAEAVRSATTELFHTLMFKYADGWLNHWNEEGFHANYIGYPKWWLEEVGYSNGPPPVTVTPNMRKVINGHVTANISPSKMKTIGGGSDNDKDNKDSSRHLSQKNKPQQGNTAGRGGVHKVKEPTLTELRDCIRACGAQHDGVYKNCAENCIHVA